MNELLTQKSIDNFLVEVEDFKFFCSEYLKIKDEDGNIIPFILNELQLKVLNHILEGFRLNTLIRLLILKCRQTGISTLIEALLFWVSLLKTNQKMLIIGHEKKASINLFDMFQRYLEFIPFRMRPTIDTNQREKKIKYKLLGNEIEVETAGSNIDTQKAGTGRSATYQFIHGTECAFYPDYITTFIGMLQASKKAKMIVLETTANGFNDFRNEWVDALGGITDYTPIFLAWIEFKAYTKSLKTEIERESLKKSLGVNPRYNDFDDEEKLLIEKHNCTLEQLNWRRWAINNLCKGDVKIFHQEYPTTWEEAFLSTGSPVFNITICNKNKEDARKPLFRGYLEPIYNTASNEYEKLVAKGKTSYYDLKDLIIGIRKVPNQKGYVKIYKEIIIDRNHKYRFVGASDVAEGLEQGDFSCIKILDRGDMEVAITWHGHIDADKLAEEQHKLQLLLNGDVHFATEINNHGITTVNTAYKLGVNQYFREIFSKGIGEETDKLGFKTNLDTRKLILDDLKEFIREELFTDPEEEMWGECLTFVKNPKGKEQAQGKDKDPATKCYDDRVLTAAIMFRCHQWLPPFKIAEIDTRPQWLKDMGKKKKVKRQQSYMGV